MPSQQNRSRHRTGAAANEIPTRRNVIVQGGRKTYAALAVIIAALIVYLGLYPFSFRVPPDDIGAWHKLMESWPERSSRGDLLANVLAYIPLGFCATTALGWHKRALIWSPIVLFAGLALSTSLELTQYFVEGRVTSLTDVCANTLGVSLGIMTAVFLTSKFEFVLQVYFNEPISLTLLAIWVGYRLYPYVPTTDLHKFWDAVKPIILSPRVDLYTVWRHTTLWLVLFALIEANLAGLRSLIGAWAFVFFVTAARIAIVGKVLSTGEIIGAAAALCIWPIALWFPRRGRAAVLACMLLGYVIVERLQPFVFQATPREFGWLPFRSFMEGSLEVSVLAFLEKCFLYGSLLFLLVAAGHRLRNSTILVALVLFLTSWAETFLPSRSAEVTDAVLVLLIALAFALVGRPEPAIRL